MGFRYWYEGIIFVFVFGVLVLVPCFLTMVIGSKMVNDLGNFPTKSARIQRDACWKALIVEIVSFFFLAVFFHILN